MSNQATKSTSQNVPDLRFQGFTSAWKKEKLGNLLRIERGGSPRPIESYITTSENGIPWIKIGDLKNGNKFVTQTAQKIKPEGVSKSREVYPGDFILSNSMSFGRPYIVKIHGCIHDGWLALRNESKEEIDDNFLYELLQSELIRKKFLSLAAGSAVKNLKSETVKVTEVEIPDLLEQKKIADFLSSANSWLDNSRSQMELLESYKKSIMQKIFSQEVRFKNDDGQDYPKWVEQQLGDISINFDNQRKPISSENRLAGAYPYYGANGIVDYVRDYIFDGEYVLVAEDGVVDTTRYPIHLATGKFWANNHAHILKGNGVSNTFLFYTLTMTKFMRYISGSAQTKLNGQVLKKIAVKIPCSDEQNKIADFLSQVDKLIESKQNQIIDTELWKKGLMQRMFI